MSEIQIDESLIGLVRPIELPAEVSEVWKELYLEPVYRWLPVADETYQDWPDRPDSGHFYGGSFWYGQATALPAQAYALAYRAAKAFGHECPVPLDRILDHAISGIRYLGFTHDSGPPDCVRVEGPNPRCSGRKWGGVGDPFFQATQTGRTVEQMCRAAWLLWDELDDETRQLVVNVAQWYADRWCDEEPKVGTYHNTQTEENGWTGLGIDFVTCLMPQHSRADKWRAGADRWIANICVTPFDASRNMAELQGRTVKDWTVGCTTHPDYTAENHGFVHPNYLSSGIFFAGSIMLNHALAGSEPPQVAWFNRTRVYEVLKKTTESDGLFLTVQGQDWWYLMHHNNTSVHALMNVLFSDSHAAYLERRCAGTARTVFDSLGDGHMFTANPERFMLNEYQSMSHPERWATHNYVTNFLLHWFIGDGAQPCSEAEFDKWQQGVHVFPHGGFVTRKGENTTASFSWRNQPVVVVQPKWGTWVVTPHFHSLSGTYKCEPAWEGGMRNRQCTVNEDGRGFAAIAQIEREGGKLIQNMALIVPENDIAFFFDHTVAAEPVTVSLQRSGEIGVRNESYSKLGQLASGKRTLYTQGCEFTAISGISEHDEWFRSDETAWANLDNAIGYLVFGSKGLAYQAKHVYPTYTGMQDFLILSCCEDEHDYQPGDIVSYLATAIYPNQTAAATQSQLGRVLRAVTEGPVDALLTEQYLGLINTADEPLTCALQFPVPDWDMLPVPDGCTATWDGSLEYEVALVKSCAELRKCHMRVASESKWEATATPSGRTYIKLLAERPAQIEVAVDGKERTVNLEPGQIADL